MTVRIAGMRRFRGGLAPAVALVLTALLAGNLEAQTPRAAAGDDFSRIVLAQGRNFGAADVTALLRKQGFRDISKVTQRGRTFTAEATSPGGERMQLVISDGNVVGARVIGGDGRR